MNNESEKAMTRLDRFASIMSDDGVEADDMDAVQLARYLEAHKVDITEPKRRFNAVLKKAKAEQRLARAKERRLEATKQAKDFLIAGASSFASVKDKVRAMIGKLQQNDPEQAAVYAREFEKATPEDLKTLEEDLLLLESENGEGNQQNSG